MSEKERLRQIVDRKARGLPLPAFFVSTDLGYLRIVWEKRPHSAEADDFRDYFPIRIVTLLEVFTRDWIRALVDHGSPYTENAARLARDSNLKFDYAVSEALVGRSFSLGDLVAHGISINNLDQLAGHFTKILGHDFLPPLATVHDRASVELRGKPKHPIISDLNEMCRRLARLFEVRHIVTHERPREPQYALSEIDQFFDAARMFIKATNERLAFLMHGDYPLTQADMTRAAGDELAQVQKALAALLSDMGVEQDLKLKEVQQAWESFADKHARLVSRVDEPFSGSMAPMIYAMTKTRLTRERIKLLEDERQER